MTPVWVSVWDHFLENSKLIMKINFKFSWKIPSPQKDIKNNKTLNLDLFAPWRGRRLEDPPVARWAQQHGIDVAQPEKVRQQSFLDSLGAVEPDVAVVVNRGPRKDLVVVGNCIIEIEPIKKLVMEVFF